MGIEPPAGFGAETSDPDKSRHQKRYDDCIAAGLVTHKAAEQALFTQQDNNLGGGRKKQPAFGANVTVFTIFLMLHGVTLTWIG